MSVSVVASNVLQLYPPCNSLNYPSARPQKVSIFITVSPNIFHQVLWVAFFVLVRVSQRKQENQNLLSPLLSLSLSLFLSHLPLHLHLYSFLPLFLLLLSLPLSLFLLCLIIHTFFSISFVSLVVVVGILLEGFSVI